MAWDNEESPWGKKRPPTPEEIVAAILKKIKDSFDGVTAKGSGSGSGTTPGGSGPGVPVGGPGGGQRHPRKVFGKILAVVVVAVLLFQTARSSFYNVEPGEQGIVQRFGAYHRTTQPGLNFLIPFVDEVIKVDIGKVRKEEFGFRTKVPGQKTVYEKRGYDAESLMLTGDKNVIDIEWIVQYRVRDPVYFVFKVKQVGQAVRDVAEAAMRQVVGNHDFDFILSHRDLVEAATARTLQAALDKYESGVAIFTVKLQDVNPPEQVKPAFNEVNEADQDMKRLVNEAEEAYNRVIPKAHGDAKRVIEEAQGYAAERVNLARGETSRFLAMLEEYARSREVTRRRMYLETLGKILPSFKEIYILPEAEHKAILPLLQLGGEKKPGTIVPVGK